MTDQPLQPPPPPPPAPIPPSPAPPSPISPNQEIIFTVNRGDPVLLSQIALSIIVLPLGFLIILGSGRTSPFFSLFFLAIYIFSYIFYFLSLRAILNSKIIFKSGLLIIERPFKSREINYDQITDINSSGWGFYFTIYKFILPATQLLGAFGSGFTYLILADGKRAELPLLFDAVREKQVLDELKRRVTKFGASNDFNLLYQKTEKNKSVPKIWVVLPLMVLAGVALSRVDTARQEKKDEIVLPDGTKQFGWRYTEFPKGGSSADWVVYYPANYSAGNISSDIMSRDVTYVDISRDPCCVKISVAHRVLDPDQRSVGWYLDSFQPDLYQEVPLGPGDDLWYKKDVEGNQVEIGRITKDKLDLRTDKYDDRWLFTISATTDKNSFDSNKAEIIGIIQSFELGPKNLKSNNPSTGTIAPTNPPAFPSVTSYTPPDAVRPEVIYPGAEFIDKTEVKPCVASKDDPAACYGKLGESGGVRFTYHVSSPFNDVLNWYKNNWSLVGGGGEVGTDSGSIFDAHITEKNSDKYLYYINITGGTSSTTVIFSANSQTQN